MQSVDDNLWNSFNRKGSTIYCFFPWAWVRNRISTHAFYYIHFLAILIAGIAKINDFECFSAYLTMQSNRFSIKLSTFANNFTNEPRKNIIIMQFMARLACKDCTNFDSRNRNKWGFWAQTYKLALAVISHFAKSLGNLLEINERNNTFGVVVMAIHDIQIVAMLIPITHTHEAKDFLLGQH